MSTKVLTDIELQALLPTISMGKDKPVTQIWLTRTEVLKVMRDVEKETLRRMEKNVTPCGDFEKNTLQGNCWNLIRKEQD
jgi:hypothetical protein